MPSTRRAKKSGPSNVDAEKGIGPVSIGSFPPATRDPSDDLKRAELVAIASTRPHPRNYRAHPESQLVHIEASLREFGFYRNVVLARDGTILAGHGVVLAATRLGHTTIPAIRLEIDPESAAALKVLALDNELGRFAEDDDRALTELLKEISEDDPTGLFGTGFDETMLAALVMVTRPANEIADVDEAAEWAGMPEYETEADRHRLVLCFDSAEDKATIVKRLKLIIAKSTGLTSTAWWPPRERADLAAVKFVQKTGEKTNGATK